MMPDRAEIDRAVELLRSADVVGMPTETVYGLAGDGFNPAALARIFEVKRRPLYDPLILHFAEAASAFEAAEDVPEIARVLAAKFWPGPLTLVLTKRAHVPDLATSGLPKVAVRVPAHPVAQALLRAFGGALAAPSANRFGRISPTDAAAVRSELGDAVPLVLDGGPCAIGVESTVLDVSGDAVTLLRTGGISTEEIDALIGSGDTRRPPCWTDRSRRVSLPITTLPASRCGGSARWKQFPKELQRACSLLDRSKIRLMSCFKTSRSRATFAKRRQTFSAPCGHSMMIHGWRFFTHCPSPRTASASQSTRGWNGGQSGNCRRRFHTQTIWLVPASFLISCGMRKLSSGTKSLLMSVAGIGMLMILPVLIIRSGGSVPIMLSLQGFGIIGLALLLTGLVNGILVLIRALYRDADSHTVSDSK